ncbi:MAG: C40 family peptidase [Parasporobacterium sp.]|nr:C40 family peptidase [Parasporobacterium sp.]
MKKIKSIVIFLLFMLFMVAGVSQVTQAANSLKQVTLSSVENTDLGVKVKWGWVSGAAKYRLFRKGPNDKTWVKVLDTTSTYGVDTNVTSGKKYMYSVRPIDAKGSYGSTYSKYKSIVFVARPTVTNVSSDVNGVKVVWKKVAGAAKYRLYRRPASSTTWKKIKDVTGSSAVDTTAVSGTKYSYTLRPINSSGKLCNTYSTYKSTTYYARPAITKAANVKTGIQLTWSKVGGAAKYRLCRKKTPDALWSTIAEIKGTSFTDTDVTIGEKYYYAVKMIDSTGVARNTYSATKTITRKGTSITVYTCVPMVTLHTQKNDASPQEIVTYMTELQLLDNGWDDNVGKWLSVIYNGKTWYTWQTAGRKMLTKTKSSYNYQTSTVYQKEVLEQAMYFLDKKTGYKYSSEGGSTGIPDKNGVYWFDCSGFSSYVINKVMGGYVPTYELSIDVDNQYATDGLYNKDRNGEFSAKTIIARGKKLDTSLLKPGDLVFFNHKTEPGRSVDHVGIYLGNNEFIHAVQLFGVCISNFSEDNYTDFVGAIRVLPQEVKEAGDTMYTKSTSSMYRTKDSSKKPLMTVEADQPVKIHFTDFNNWAYVSVMSNSDPTATAGEEVCGFMYLDRLTDEDPRIEYETRFIGRNTQKLYLERSTSGKYITLEYGTAVEYGGKYGTTDYYRVMYEGSQYYIYTTENIDNVLLKEYPWTQQQMYVVKDQLNLYLQRSATSGADRISVPLGTELTYMGKYGTSDFYMVLYEGKEYYIYSTSGIDGILSEEKPQITYETRFIGRTTEKLFAERSSSGNYIVLDFGTAVEYGGRCYNTNWYRVQYEGIDYYVNTTQDIDTVLLKESPWTWQQMYVSGVRLNLYPERSTSGGNSITLMVGEPVIYLGQYAATNYHKVLYQRQEYYIYSATGIDEILTEDQEYALSVKEIMFTTSSCKLRSSMDSSDDSNLIMVLPADAEVGVIARDGTWAYVRCSMSDPTGTAEDVTGFVSSTRLSE